MNNPIRIKVLIVPKFEIGEMTGDFPGEAQLFYEEYCMDSKEYVLKCGSKLYVDEKKGIALGVTGSGKVNTSIYMTAVLCDERFCFDDTFIFSTGCCGTNYEKTVFGDVVVLSAAVDYDLGNSADVRDMGDCESENCWFNCKDYDDVDCKVFNKELTDKVFELVKDTKLETTKIARESMKRNFPNSIDRERDARVLRGTTVTADNYWKGEMLHKRAKHITRFYGCPDEYLVTEMEEIAIADVLDRFDMLDRFVSIRVSVNVDTFLDGNTPETLWGGDNTFAEKVDSDNLETLDIFEPAMHNAFLVGKKIIDYLL